MSTDLGWSIVVEVSILCCFLLLGAFLRARIKFFQKYLVPIALIGGFLAMLSNKSFMGQLPFNIYIPFDDARLGIYVYHLLSVTFVAMALRSGGKGKGRDAVAMGLNSSFGYAIQGVVGIGLGLLLMYTIYPGLFPTFGALAPLGFGQGPGLTYSLAHNWEVKKNFADAGNLGLTLASIGYFWACFIGVPIVNYGIKKGWSNLVKDKSHLTQEVYVGFFSKDSKKPVAGKLTTTSEAVESFAFHVALIGFVFLLMYIIMSGMVDFLAKIGAEDIADTFEGFFFIFATLLALLIRIIIKKLGFSHIIDDGTMSRIAGVSVDFLVVAAIASISLSVIGKFILPIIITSTAVGIITIFTSFWFAKRSYIDYPFERAIAIYGMLTGTINSGLILLRMMDPEYKSPVAQDLVYTSAIALPLCFPLLLLINRPLKGVETIGSTWVTSDPSFYWQTLIGIFIMTIILLLVYRLSGLMKLKRPWRKMWLEDK